MNSRSILNLLLLVLLLAMAAFLVYKKNQPQKILRLSDLQIDSITRIEIPRAGGKTILLKKMPGKLGDAHWWMQQPYQIRAHEFRVKNLLNLSQTVVDKVYPVDQLKLSDYGLDNPRAKIIFNQTEIDFGKANPLNNRRYLRSGNRLVLIEDQLYPLVSAEAAAFVALELLPENKNINALQIDDWIIENKQGIWQSQPAGKLNADQIQQLIENWQSLQAYAVHAYMPRKTDGRIIVHLGRPPSSEQIEFEVSEDDSLILARRDLGLEYHLDKSLKEKILANPDA